MNAIRNVARTLVAFSIWIASVDSSWGHPGHSHRTTDQSERIWTLPNGYIHGTYVASREDRIQIRQSDDTLTTVLLSELSNEDQTWIQQKRNELNRANWALKDRVVASRVLADDFFEFSDSGNTETDTIKMLLAQANTRKKTMVPGQPPEISKAFEAFVKNNSIRTRWDDRYFYVEGKGIPSHRMMVGITAWQQQVPIPQAYEGGNAWQIPLHPVPAKVPASAKNRFLRGAIAVAVNGIPIFNPLNNRGDDAYLFGELDEFGGHCGRADDYHYHIAPVHLEKIQGKGLPIAYALDGYPIYGYEEPDGSPVKGLDALNGHRDENGNYHYHATKTYPYLNGGFFGEVVEKEGQVDPQPRAEPLRSALPPLKNAKIVDFAETAPGSFLLTYEVQGKKGTVSYALSPDGAAKFTFVDTNGRATQETYTPKRRGPGGAERRPPPRADDKPPRNSERPGEKNGTVGDRGKGERNAARLNVFSSSVDKQGFVSVDCTCDGSSQSPEIEWKDVPKGTKSFVVSLWHTAPDQEKSYWLVYNIPGNVAKLAKNSKGIGLIGLNDRKRAEYDPMCSKGPGIKNYHITVYALSAELKISAPQATRANVLAAIRDITLAEGTLDFQYERKEARTQK